MQEPDEEKHLDTTEENKCGPKMVFNCKTGEQGSVKTGSWFNLTDSSGRGPLI
jgi:hypothetical protein